jgi:exosortase/archaeosortase family protein
MPELAAQEQHPISTSSIGGGVPLSQFGLYLLVLLAVQYWAGTAALVARSPSVDALERALTQISVLPGVEWWMLFGFVRRLPERTLSARMAYGSLALVVAAFTLIAHQRFAFLFETFALFILWLGTPDLKRTGLILLFIALQRGQGMTPLHALISWVDTRVLSGFMTMIGQPVTRIGNLVASSGTPDGLVILAGCASSNLMLPMGLGLAILLLISRDPLRRRDYGWIAVTLAIAVAINIVRLTLMLGSHAAYESWHEGVGASIVSAAGLIVTMGVWMVATDPKRPMSAGTAA